MLISGLPRLLALYKLCAMIAFRNLCPLPILCIISLSIALFSRVFTSFTLLPAIQRFKSLESPLYKYVGSDVPNELPGYYPEVAMIFEKDDANRYPLDENDIWNTLYPESLGLVRLGPKGRPFGISLYHQLHCLNSIRYAYMVARLGLVADPASDTTVYHNTHCFHFIRQSILCHADLTLIPVDDHTHGRNNTIRPEELHRCRDWTKIREFADKNHARWKDVPLTQAWEDVDI